MDERFKSLIKNKYEIGPIRLGKHYEYLENNDKYKNQLPNYKYRVLVLDFHSVSGFYQNGRCFSNNWKNNLKFYQDILSLCTSFPQAHFMIKGKNYDFINIPYFSDVVNQIEEAPNCMLVKDYEKWTPYTSVAVSDIAIALHTSLGDEMLALGKPVIFYEYVRFASEFYDYGSDVIAYNYFQIEKKLKNYFSKPVKYNKDLISIKTKTYSLNNITPIKKLHQYLDEIYKRN